MSEPVELLIIGGGPAGLAAARCYRELADERRRRDRHRRAPDALRTATADQGAAAGRDRVRAAGDRGRGLADRPASPADQRPRRDARRRRAHVTLSGGRQLAYATCLLATGAEPTRLPIPGADHPRVRVVRTRRPRPRAAGPVARRAARVDRDRLRVHRLRDRRLAADARSPGRPRVRRDRARTPPVSATRPADDHPRVAASDGARAARSARRSTGSSRPVAVDRDRRRSSDRRGRDRDGDPASVRAPSWPSRPDVELDDGAIAVDASMRTARDGLLAAGDVCQAYNRAAGRALRVEHWGDALAQGKIAGATAAGADAGWDSVPGFWSTIGRRTLKYAAWGDGYEEISSSATTTVASPLGMGAATRSSASSPHDADDDYDRGAERIARGPDGAGDGRRGSGP